MPSSDMRYNEAPPRLQMQRHKAQSQGKWKEAHQECSSQTHVSLKGRALEDITEALFVQISVHTCPDPRTLRVWSSEQQHWQHLGVA